MKIIILCGGSGSRLEDYSFPKPLNMIYGKPAIYYTLKELPDCITDLHFIVAEHLYSFNFEEIVINTFPTKNCIFYKLPYFTRGPIESAWLGTLSLSETDENIVFLDNDVTYTFPEGFFTDKPHAFLGYSIDTTGAENFSFLKLTDTYVTEYKEKIRISEYFCCGVYGFKHITQFREFASQVLYDTNYKNEYYMSILFQTMIQRTVPICGIYFGNKLYHIGSITELKCNLNNIPKRTMRICFDLDNTLVTYPTVPKDYSTVKPIWKMINQLRTMKEDGHTIIIYTARRMETHKGNVGTVMKDIGKITFDTLEKYNIPYDELIFGKPIADVYIDDKAVNPYFQAYSLMGYLKDESLTKPLNYLQNNCYNTIEVKNNKIVKSGPITLLEGEIYYYENIPPNSILTKYYPQYYGSEKKCNAKIHMENIKGIPLYFLYKSELLNTNHLDMVFEYTDCLHNYILKNDDSFPTLEEVKKNYVDKLVERFKSDTDYPFSDSKQIQLRCLEVLADYFQSDSIKIAPYIHGDLWFSNIMIDYKHQLKVFDMKGKVFNKLTLAGDVYYDYGKLYQSILGYDFILNKEPINMSYMKKMEEYFITNIEKRNISYKMLKIVTFSLVIGTLPFVSDSSIKQSIWNWMKETFAELL